MKAIIYYQYHSSNGDYKDGAVEWPYEHAINIIAGDFINITTDDDDYDFLVSSRVWDVTCKVLRIFTTEP